MIAGAVAQAKQGKVNVIVVEHLPGGAIDGDGKDI
jgi:hypothetical protein